MTLLETIQTLTALHASLLATYGDEAGGFLFDHGQVRVEGDEVTLWDGAARLTLTKETIEELVKGKVG